MLRLLCAAQYGHPTAVAMCAWWVDNYGCLPDSPTDTNEQAHAFVAGPFMIFPPR